MEQKRDFYKDQISDENMILKSPGFGAKLTSLSRSLGKEHFPIDWRDQGW